MVPVLLIGSLVDFTMEALRVWTVIIIVLTYLIVAGKGLHIIIYIYNNMTPHLLRFLYMYVSKLARYLDFENIVAWSYIGHC